MKQADCVDLQPFFLACKETQGPRRSRGAPGMEAGSPQDLQEANLSELTNSRKECTQLYSVTSSVLPFLSLHGLCCLPSQWVQSDSFGMEGFYLLPPPFPLHSFPTDPGDRPALECNLLSPSAFIPTRPQKSLQYSLWEGGLWQTLGVCGGWGQNCF